MTAIDRLAQAVTIAWQHRLPLAPVREAIERHGGYWLPGPEPMRTAPLYVGGPCEAFGVAATLAWNTGWPFPRALDAVSTLFRLERQLQAERGTVFPVLNPYDVRDLETLDAMLERLRTMRRQHQSATSPTITPTTDHD